jgi:hypothetical protein
LNLFASRNVQGSDAPKGRAFAARPLLPTPHPPERPGCLSPPTLTPQTLHVEGIVPHYGAGLGARDPARVAPLMRQTDLRNERGRPSLPLHTTGRPEEGDAPEDFMYADHPARLHGGLREFVRNARRAANATFELQAKESFGEIAEGLSAIAEEIERSGPLKG